MARRRVQGWGEYWSKNLDSGVEEIDSDIHTFHFIMILMRRGMPGSSLPVYSTSPFQRVPN
jgi:hypothetical protein